jgi:hypothetical protein
VYATFGTLVAAFVVHSTVQVVAAIFELRPKPTRPLPAPCAAGVRALLASADRAARAAQGIADAKQARDAFRRALSPEWDTQGVIAARCSDDPDGIESYADVVRLGRELEANAAEGAVRTGPTRRSLERRLGMSESR